MTAPDSRDCNEDAPVQHDVPPCLFVLFGATGDLSRRKLIPALFSLHQQKLLPAGFALVAYARRDKNDEIFRSDLQQAVRQFSPKLEPSGASWDEFASNIFYVRGNLDDAGGYERLSERLDQIETERKLEGRRLFYLATPPENFTDIITRLGAAKLNQVQRAGGWSRIIVEKPFGGNLEEARALNAELLSVFSEEQVYRIDHYLGKETVQNILVLRFANQIFEPLWNEKYIDHVRITVAESIGMEGRGSYFEQSGITRDVVQNHALQVLTLIAMEPPGDLSADAVRDEKVKVLKAIQPFTPDLVARRTVRGQYGPGKESGAADAAPAAAYRSEEEVAPDSSVETFAAFQFAVQNWRWAGVPFYVQAGKRMPERLTEVRIQFKAIPEVLFSRLACADVRPNRLTLRIQPNEGASLEIGSKTPGPEMRVQPVRMDFNYGASFHSPIRDAYERLILDAIRGDASLFARNDEVEAAWAVITPILDAWRDLSCPIFPNYPAGTWGPAAARTLVPSD